ncbi:unnamed protein product [Phytophthora lilii]|uniref:Unnamed protein product n=1 Tax=Phytophthora lilii TaxID=2077276 RepID=A0A9W6TJD2_9STRA|nr:unnamed protein product [Phytophthora lilii]
MKLSRPNALGVFTSLVLASSACATATAVPMSAVQVFDEDSCSGAPLQVVFSPAADCSTLRPDTNCSLESQEQGLFASGNCTDDPRKFAASAFGDSPYVLVKLYTPDTNCETLEGISAYRVDNGCHPTIAAGTSFQADWSDTTPSLKLFADESCTSSPVFQLELSIDSSECIGGSMKLRVNADLSSSSTGSAN